MCYGTMTPISQNSWTLKNRWQTSNYLSTMTCHTKWIKFTLKLLERTFAWHIWLQWKSHTNLQFTISPYFHITTRFDERFQLHFHSVLHRDVVWKVLPKYHHFSFRSFLSHSQDWNCKKTNLLLTCCIFRIFRILFQNS